MEQQIEKENMAREYIEAGYDALAENRILEAWVLVYNALKLAEQSGNMKMYVAYLSSLGVVYALSGHEHMAIDCYQKGIQLSLSNHFYGILTHFYNNLGTQYQESERHQIAVKYFLEAEGALNYEECKNNERYSEWAILTYINLGKSYTEIGNYELAEYYLKKAVPFFKCKEGRRLYFEYMVTEAQLYWRLGKKKEVALNLEQILEDVKQFTNGTSNYVQGIVAVCDLLGEMREFDKWKRMIEFFAEFVKGMNSAYYQMLLAERWMAYYKALNDTGNYKSAYEAYMTLSEVKKQECDRFDKLFKSGGRNQLEDMADNILETCVELNIPLCIGYYDMKGYKTYLQSYGQECSDEVLKMIFDIIGAAVKGKGKVYHVNTDEFLAFIPAVDKEYIELISDKIEDEIRNTNKNIELAQGYIKLVPTEQQKFTELVELAQLAMYRARDEHGSDIFIDEM